MKRVCILAYVAVLLHAAALFAVEPLSLDSRPANNWVKRSPLSNGPVSPGMGYEGACVWDSRHQLLVRYGGHNQGGGGEQGAEVWTFDPLTAKWTLKEPNTSPPGVCCNKRNVYDPTIGRYIRFPKFSGSHGWHYIVAVDALGQEGFPSSPAWFHREWQAYYKPFVGEWHQ
jgi:hypothetical protein